MIIKDKLDEENNSLRIIIKNNKEMDLNNTININDYEIKSPQKHNSRNLSIFSPFMEADTNTYYNNKYDYHNNILYDDNNNNKLSYAIPELGDQSLSLMPTIDLNISNSVLNHNNNI